MATTSDTTSGWQNPGLGTYRIRNLITATINHTAKTASVRARSYLQANSATSYTGITTTFFQSIDGVTTLNESKKRNHSLGATVTIADKTRTVSYNSNGNKSVSVVARAENPTIKKISYTSSLNLDAVTPKPPTKPTVSNITETAARVNSSQNGNINISTWQTRLSRNSNMSSASTSSSQPANFSGLIPGTTYYTDVRGQNSHGWSGRSAVTSFVTRPKALAPTLDSVTPTGFRITENHEGGTAGSTVWTAQVSKNSNFSGSTTYTLSPSRTLSNLDPATQYYVRVYGTNNSGKGVNSPTVTITTAPANPPTFTVTPNESGGSAQVAVTPYSGISSVTYTVQATYISPPRSPMPSPIVVSSGNPNITVTGLIPGGTYEWRVKAQIANFDSGYSAAQTLTQPNPANVSAEYFDEYTTDDPPLSYVSGPGGAASEMGPSVKNWRKSANSTQIDVHTPIYQHESVMIPGISQGHVARTRLTQNITEAHGVLSLINTGVFFPVLPEATYTVMIAIRPTADITVQMQVIQSNEEPILFDEILCSGGEITWLNNKFYTDPDVQGVALQILVVEGDAGTFIDFDCALLALGRYNNYWDGSLPDSTRYAYSWEDDENDSVSFRTLLPSTDLPDPFEDPNCPPPPSPPRPVEILNPCIDADIDTWRRYWIPIEESDVSGVLSVLPTFTITTGEDSAEQVRIRVYENPDNTAAEDFVPEEIVSEQIIAYMPANSEIILDGVSERAYGDSGGVSQDVDHLIFGTGGTPATYPVLRCGIPYMVSIDVPADSTVGNINAAIDLTIQVG